jgi:hypothetical protein
MGGHEGETRPCGRTQGVPKRFLNRCAVTKAVRIEGVPSQFLNRRAVTCSAVFGIRGKIGIFESTQPVALVRFCVGSRYYYYTIPVSINRNCQKGPSVCLFAPLPPPPPPAPAPTATPSVRIRLHRDDARSLPRKPGSSLHLSEKGMALTTPHKALIPPTQ